MSTPKHISEKDRKEMFRQRFGGARLKELSIDYGITIGYAGEICRAQCFQEAIKLTSVLADTTDMTADDITKRVFNTYQKFGFKNDPNGNNYDILQQQIKQTRGQEKPSSVDAEPNDNRNHHKAEIFGLRKQGLTFAAIGARYHLSASRIAQICNEECCKEAKAMTRELLQDPTLSDDDIIQTVITKYAHLGLTGKNRWGQQFVHAVIRHYRKDHEKDTTSCACP